MDPSVRRTPQSLQSLTNDRLDRPSPRCSRQMAMCEEMWGPDGNTLDRMSRCYSPTDLPQRTAFVSCATRVVAGRLDSHSSQFPGEIFLTSVESRGLTRLLPSCAKLFFATLTWVSSVDNVGVLGRFQAGGFTRFRRMPSGAWIVDEWRLRVPKVQIKPGEQDYLSSIGYIENGGGTIAETVKSERSQSNVRVAGVVYDSVAEMPLRGATISLDANTTTSDTAGRFTLTNVGVGPQTLVVSHPALSAFGSLALERQIEVGADTTVLLATPSLKTLWLRICSDSSVKVSVRERGILQGVVHDNSGAPVNGARVQMYWTQYGPSPGTRPETLPLSLAVTTDSEGHYAACGFRRLTQGTAFAVAGTRTSPHSAFNSGESLLVRRDLTLIR